ncbi:hypothetical protein F2Q70_00001356 [Brassica cretica]|uniref:Uncharacterized protein n=1 Tax=Brassica cretica TaxID=69181 RepID=A0A8S9IWT0_BRACR|nr:hypothetical protein F2Q70_00001356 [Brassica cretica]
MDPPDKDPDPDILKLPGYPIRSRPSCRETHRNHHRSSTQITTDPPPINPPPINPPPIETTTDPPPIIQTTTDPPPIETTTVRSKGSKPPPFEGKVRNHHRSKPPPCLCLLVFSVTEEGSKHTIDGNPPPRPTIPLSLDSSDVVGIVAKLSKLSEVTGAIEAIDVTDPENKNGFYSGSAGSNEADQRRVTWKCLKLVLIASPGRHENSIRYKRKERCFRYWQNGLSFSRKPGDEQINKFWRDRCSSIPLKNSAFVQVRQKSIDTFIVSLLRRSPRAAEDNLTSRPRPVQIQSSRCRFRRLSVLWMVLEDSVRLVAPISSFDGGLCLVRFSYLVSALPDRWRMRRQRPLRGVLSSFSVACKCCEDVFFSGSDWSCYAPVSS